MFASLTRMAKLVLSNGDLKNSVGKVLMENTARSQPADGEYRSITDIDRTLTVALLLVDARENHTHAQDVGNGKLLGDCRIKLLRTLLDFFLRHRFDLAHHLGQLGFACPLHLDICNNGGHLSNRLRLKDAA